MAVASASGRSANSMYLMPARTAVSASALMPVIITGGRADLATTVEIHTTREIDGYHRMEQLPQLTVAPGEQVDLSPGGIHLMLLGLQRMPTAGERTRLCLTLESGDSTCTEAEVRKSAREQDNHDHHQHH